MAAIKYVFAKNAADLEKIQATAVRSVQKARTKVQIASVATIRHAWEHGDWTYAQRLVEALGNTINGKALVEWFVQFGGLTVEEGKGFSGWKGKAHIEENFEKAKATMWWTLAAKNPFAGYNLEEQLQRILEAHKKIQKKVVGLTAEEQKKVSFDVNEDTIKAVLRLCNFEAIIEDNVIVEGEEDKQEVEQEVEKAVA